METPIGTLITTILVGILVLVGGTTILGSYASYNPTLDSGNLTQLQSKAQDSYNNMNAASSNIQSSMQNFQQNAGIFGFLDSLINIGYNLLASLFSSLGFASTMILYIPAVLGLPLWIFGLATMFIAVFIGLAIASAIFRIRL